MVLLLKAGVVPDVLETAAAVVAAAAAAAVLGEETS